MDPLELTWRNYSSGEPRRTAKNDPPKISAMKISPAVPCAAVDPTKRVECIATT